MALPQIIQTIQALTSHEAIIFLLLVILFGEKIYKFVYSIIDIINSRSKCPTKKLKSFAITSKKVAQILEMYRESFKAARVSFCVFHNGGYDISGVPFLKYSCLDEVVCKGATPYVALTQNIHLYLLVDLLEGLTGDNVVSGFTKTFGSSTFRKFLEDRDVFSGMVAPVWSDRILVGFVSVQWTSPKYSPKTQEELDSYEEEIRQMAKLVEIERFKDAGAVSNAYKR